MERTIRYNTKGIKILSKNGKFSEFKGVSKSENKVHLLELKLEDGENLICTFGHKILVKEDFFLEAQVLCVGDTIISNGLPVKIVSIETKDKDYVYDALEVAENHEYVTNSVVSHNCEFLGSSNTLISGSKLSIMIQQCKNRIIRENNLDLYETPKEDRIYTIVVDVAEGQNKDYSAFSIIDVTEIPYRQVGKYRDNKISPMLFPSIIYNVAKRFNDAYVLVEINSIGLQVANILFEEFFYENLLKVDTKSPQGIGQHITGGYKKGIHLGVKTSTAIKRIGCANLKTLIESDKLIVFDDDTVNELKSFTAKNESFAAEQGRNDDLTMTLVLFSWLSSQAYFREMVSNNIRSHLQDETLRVVDDVMTVRVQKSLKPIGDPFSLNWKNDYDWEALEAESEVDVQGDRWFTVDGNR